MSLKKFVDLNDFREGCPASFYSDTMFSDSNLSIQSPSTHPTCQSRNSGCLKELKKIRIRQEALRQKIAVDPLPQDVCEHELFTTWVSPVMMRVAIADDPLTVLRKTGQQSQGWPWAR